MSRFRKKSKVKFKFKKFSKRQIQLLDWWKDWSPYKDRDVVIADGAIRSGKTIACICSFLQWANFTFKSEEFIIAGKSMGALKRNIIKPMTKILNAWDWKFLYNRSGNFIEIGNNTFYFFGANNEASQDVLQGLTAAGAFADEAALFPKSFIDQMIGRCSIDGSKVFMNCNPRSPFHYIKTDFIDMAAEKNILHLHFELEDNLTLTEKIITRYKRMYSGVFYKRFILGLWCMAEGIIFDMFDRKKNIKDKIPFEFYNEAVTVDYGTANPCVFHHVQYNQASILPHFHFENEYYYSGRDTGIQKTDKKYADDMEDFFKHCNLEKFRHPIIVDPSAASFILELQQRGFIVYHAINDVINGIRKMQSMIANLQVTYSQKCQKTFMEFETYSWDAKKQLIGEDAPIKKFDHCMDADRYAIMTITLTTAKVGRGITR